MHEHCHCGHAHADEPSARNKYEAAFARHEMPYTDEEIHAAAARLIAENRARYDTPETLRRLLSTIELTTLTVTDSNESVLGLVDKVNRFADAHPDLPHLATICVYPNFAETVSQNLEADGVRVACVSGGFPSSQTFIEVKTVETALAVKDGAEEIDMVLSVGKFLSGDYETCADEIAEIKASAGAAPLKVILETGALATAGQIHRAAVLSMYAGADFIKTSTGKISVAATPEAAYVMCRAIRQYFEQTGRRVGFKAAGGIRTVAEAVDFYTIVAELLGEDWLKEGLFRIGTSSLLGKLCTAVLDGEEHPF